MTPTTHQKGSRRRGQVLESAIFRATLDELAENGYAKLTMERVAERARASKASIYRRWATRVELVLDAVRHTMPDPSSPPDTGSLRGDLIASFRQTADVLAGPAGEAMRGLLSEALGDDTSMIRVRLQSQGTGRRAVEEITRRAIERGEIDAGSVTPRRLETPYALLRMHFLVHGAPIPDDVIHEIVDEVVVPLFHTPVTREAQSGARTTA
ncbi:MAG TPA: TetR/AcrR family transcriptional regulator [Actinopolymorphaceae bacterium]|jgi:AcrR family transcriptional regulator